MAVIDSAVLLLRGHTYSGSGDWLDESGNGYDGVISGATFDTSRKAFLFDADNEEIRVAHTADLEFGASDDLTILAVFEHTSLATIQFIAGKASNLSTAAGYRVYYNQSGDDFRPYIADGTFAPTDVIDDGGSVTVDTRYVVGMVRNTTDDDIEAFLDGTGSGSPTTDTTTGSLANTLDFTIGRLENSNLYRLTGYVYAVAVWDTALSDADVASASDELLTHELTATLTGTTTVASLLDQTFNLISTIESSATLVASLELDTVPFTMTVIGDQTGDGNIINELGSTVNTYLSIDDDPDTPDTADFVFSNGVDGYKFYDLTETPSDFAAINTLTARLDIQKINVTGSISWFGQVFAANETDTYTDEITLATQASTDGLQEVAFTVNSTGLAASKAEWDTARVKIRCDYT